MSHILFVGIDYYGYTQRIVGEMTAQGHNVDYRPIEFPTFLHKSVRRYAPQLYRRMLDRYHRSIVASVAGHAIDVVVFLQVHHFSHARMEALRAALPGTKFVLYNWDSLTTHDYAPYLRHFDRAWTFDPNDAATLEIGYLPLFALPEYFRRPVSADGPTHDIYFVGSVHSMARYWAVRGLIDRCARDHLTLKLFLHISPVMYLRLLRGGLLIDGMSRHSIGTDAILAMMDDARAVYDYANHAQAGYTMRLIENMCADKKVITANGRIADEPFYSPDRFLYAPDIESAPLRTFIDAPVASMPDFDQFSLSNWARALLTR